MDQQASLSMVDEARMSTPAAAIAAQSDPETTPAPRRVGRRLLLLAVLAALVGTIWTLTAKRNGAAGTGRPKAKRRSRR